MPGPPLFPSEWSVGTVVEGDSTRLRKAYHRAAARLHPDKVRGHPLAVRVTAEELFKVMSAAHERELRRLQEGLPPDMGGVKV